MSGSYKMLQFFSNWGTVSFSRRSCSMQLVY